MSSGPGGRSWHHLTRATGTTATTCGHQLRADEIDAAPRVRLGPELSGDALDRFLTLAALRREGIEENDQPGTIDGVDVVQVSLKGERLGPGLCKLKG
ncbi:MAG: hypothetical protein A2005_12495 [Desulfuromonadales bacterium GWC2_61_20]|nr:MAG: hypothetical protein A2005_12495 [Desulfuromonadales bacterium GWC2_61_20]